MMMKDEDPFQKALSKGLSLLDKTDDAPDGPDGLSDDASDDGPPVDEQEMLMLSGAGPEVMEEETHPADAGPEVLEQNTSRAPGSPVPEWLRDNLPMGATEILEDEAHWPHTPEILPGPHTPEILEEETQGPPDSQHFYI